MLIQDTEDIWQCQFPRLSQQCFVILTSKNHELSKTSGTNKPEVMRAFALEGPQDFSDPKWVMLASCGQHQEMDRRKQR